MTAKKFTDDELQRYARHIILPQVGGVGQRKLLDSRVMVIGAGGLGSPVILYLAAAGVGAIDVVDADRVDLSNLQRQIIHTTDRIGESKVASAEEAVRQLNPDIQLHAHNEWLSAENVERLFAPVDLVVDGSDNFPTRFLVNDACYFFRKPLISGAMFRFEGQLSVFPNDGAEDSPCYRCLFPEPPPEGLIPSCQEAGIFGSIPGVIGSLQATEAIKLLLGKGDTLVRRLLLFDGLAMKFREVKIKRDKSCPLNGDEPTITEIIEYQQRACES